MSNTINFYEQGYRDNMDAMLSAVEALELPMLRATTDCTIAGLQYIPDMYDNYRDIVSKYVLLFKRDIRYISERVAALVQRDVDYSMGLTSVDPTTYRSQVSHTSSLLYGDVNAELAEYTVGPAAHMYPDWLFKITDLDNMISNVAENMVNLLPRIQDLKVAIETFVVLNNISGAGADEMKSNFRDIHFSICDGLRTAAQTIYTKLFAYWHTYYDTYPVNTNGSEYTIDKGGMRIFLNGLDDVMNNMRSINANCSYAATTLYMDSNYAIDYRDLLPDIQPTLDKYHEMEDEAEALLDAIDANEDYLITIQSELEDPILLVVEEINAVIDAYATASGTSGSFTNALEQIDFNGYNETYSEIRASNEENIDDLCWGFTRAGEVNTEFEDTIDSLHTEQDIMIGIISFYFGALGIGEMAMFGASSFEWASALISLLGTGYDLQGNIFDGLSLWAGYGDDAGYDFMLMLVVFLSNSDRISPQARTILNILTFILATLSGNRELIDTINGGVGPINDTASAFYSVGSDVGSEIDAARHHSDWYLSQQNPAADIADGDLFEWGVSDILLSLDSDTIIALETAIMLLLRDNPAEAVVVIMEDCGFPRSWAEGLVYSVADRRSDYVHGDGLGDTIADSIEQNLEVENYHATLDDEGYDEARLRELGLIG